MSTLKSAIPVSTGQKSHRNLSAPSIGTTDFGRLDVLYHTPINPGEDVNISVKGVLQSAPLQVNTFGEFRYDTRVFFVPNRILCHRPEEGRSNFVWDYYIQHLSNLQHPYTTLRLLSDVLINNGNAYFTGTNKELYQQDFRRLCSQLRFPSWLVNTTELLSDTSVMGNKRISIFPFLAYQRIWWDFYRNTQWIDDSLLSNYIPYPGAGLNGLYSGFHNQWIQPRYVCWDKDYFTNCLPAEQVNVTQASNPFGAAASVTNSSSLTLQALNVASQYIQDENGNLISADDTINAEGRNLIPASWIRSALAIDNYLQRMNIAGTRIKDRLKARFGIDASYERANTALYLGGSSQKFTVGKMNIFADTYTPSEGAVVGNAFNLNSLGTGELSGQRIGNIDQGFGMDNIKFHSQEYGTLMVIGVLVPKTGYFQGLNKDLTLGVGVDDIEESRQSYLTPELSNIGLQPLRVGELFTNSILESVDDVFGWTERYGNYGWQPAVVDGDMVLSGTSTGMDAMHMFREFDEASVPVNGNAFCTITPVERKQLDRIFKIPNPSVTTKSFDHFTRFTSVDCDIVRAMPSSWLPELYEDNNHGNTTTVQVGGSHL